MTSPYQYWAFISYSSKDERWGRWLHKAIESYGIPSQFVGRPTPVQDPAPKRFQPVFRDRDELPASADLGAGVDNALRASRFLIVVCSPQAARSRWVNTEIETFRRVGSADRILAVIVDGEPGTNDERECFPPALKAQEPIAADARPEADGKVNAKLKLLAGMLGVSFDALRQRETRRRIRRLQLVAGLALMGATVLAGIATYAFYQRNRAVIARQQAESILQFLVYDMRDALEPVGRLDIVDRVQKRVDEYYKQLGIEESQPTTLRNRAAALDNQGNLAFHRGDLNGALGGYRASLAVAERLAASEPTNTSWQRDLSVSHGGVGDVLQSQGDLPGALKAYRASLGISERLAAADPTNTSWQRDLSVSHERLGDVLQSQGDLPGALKAYRASLDIRERLAAADPTNTSWQRDLSVGHDRVGDVLQSQGDLPGALKAYRASLGSRERLAAADSNNTSWQRNLSVSHNKVGDVLQSRGDLPGALKVYRASLGIRERLAAADPTNTSWQRDLSVSHGGVGDVLQSQGDLPGALKAYRASLGISERLAAADPTNTSWQRDLSVDHEKVGDVLQRRGDLPGALKAYRASLGIRERLAAADSNNTSWQRDLSVSYNKVGDVLQSQGDLPGALKTYRASLGVRERLAAADPSNATWQRDVWVSNYRIAVTLERQGQPAREFLQRAYVTLSAMKQKGIFISREDERALAVLRRKVEGSK